MKKTIKIVAALTGILSCSAPLLASAESVIIPVGEQGLDRAATALPSLGMNKQYVEKNFGSPNSRKGPVGDPPIYTWVYDDYTVYFEYDTVIHTVLEPKPTTASSSSD
ncbi:hypothetical protein [Halioxenophilus sp. WMMB6]|uniref:hypothetical protein n=1 Tax=Halioxenophilus sp. WMMB6 TaxID=3073815 RepID=UPI00295ECA14|nr:hypothetical protein [Halioxenophilus sp. WMMB6]